VSCTEECLRGHIQEKLNLSTANCRIKLPLSGENQTWRRDQPKSALCHSGHQVLLTNF